MRVLALHPSLRFYPGKGSWKTIATSAGFFASLIGKIITRTPTIRIRDGVAHATYEALGKVFYANNTTGKWKWQRWFPLFSENPSLDVDHNGAVGISYTIDANVGDNEGLIFVSNHGGSWTETVVDSQATHGAPTQLRVDSQGNFHIIYTTGSYNRGVAVKYASNATGSWEHRDVYRYPVRLSGGIPKMTIDDADDIHVVHYDQEFGVLLYSSSTNGVWNQTKQLLSHPDITEYAMDVDSSGDVHVAYQIEKELLYQKFVPAQLNVNAR